MGRSLINVVRLILGIGMYSSTIPLDIQEITIQFYILSLLHNTFQSTMNISFNLTKYTGVMAFYAVLTYILFPAIAYFLFGKTLEAAGNGFIVGSIVSVILWRMVGMGMVKGA